MNKIEELAASREATTSNSGRGCRFAAGFVHGRNGDTSKLRGTE